MNEADELNEVTRILWGKNINQDIFKRWNQGFVFSEQEPTALKQLEGGPCAVITPVQGFILKNLIYKMSIPNWRQPSNLDLDNAFISALCDILELVFNDKYIIVNSLTITASDSLNQDTNHPQNLSTEEMKIEMKNKINAFKNQCGVLNFLYSVLLTKGLERLKNEIVDLEETLIDPTHGHGSQNLINLLLTGQAVSYVWDNEKEVSGFIMNGILKKTQIGFLTLLEHLRYCEVGLFLKNPSFPIWLLGSETHLTLLFSQDDTIVSNITPENSARQAFSKYDVEKQGFIRTDKLEDLLTELELFADPLYVEIISEKLDPEQLGIITLNNFMDEFFPSSAEESNSVKCWPIFHYNGLARSNFDSQVVYSEGTCEISETPEMQMMTDHSPIKKCLLTKWPTIDIKWNSSSTPSIN